MDLAEKIKRCLERHPDWTDKRICNATGARHADVGAMRRGEGLPSREPVVPLRISDEQSEEIREKVQTWKAMHPPTPKVKAIPLSGVHLLSKKPVDLMKGRLYGLERGMGYPVADLARAWGVSEETLKYHAKNHKALAYVEATPGEYVPIVVHPETPKGDSL
jgi:hypothetical protein